MRNPVSAVILQYRPLIMYLDRLGSQDGCLIYHTVQDTAHTASIREERAWKYALNCCDVDEHREKNTIGKRSRLDRKRA